MRHRDLSSEIFDYKLYFSISYADTAGGLAEWIQAPHSICCQYGYDDCLVAPAITVSGLVSTRLKPTSSLHSIELTIDRSGSLQLSPCSSSYSSTTVVFWR